MESNKTKIGPETATQMIAVDAVKLGQGLKRTFEGVALVFDSIGAGEDAAGLKTAVEKAVEMGTEGSEVKEKLSVNVDIKPDTAEAVEAKEKMQEPEQSEDTIETMPVSVAPDAVQDTISADDVTKIIVQKIKKNRKNNDKIGAILQTFGVARVSELPSDQYEAFVTELAEL